MDIDDLHARLERLAFSCDLGGQDRPPLETYTVTPTSHGDVCRATPDYVRWFLRTYPAAGREDRARLSSFGAAAQGVGGPTF